jgi:enoyl-CoA hydratase/carnithine racemase
MHAELSRVFKYYDNEPTLWVAIVTGNGRAFSAGYDLKEAAGIDFIEPDLTGLNPNGEPDCQGVIGGTGFAGLTDRQALADGTQGIKPVIAAVNGIAHGGGFETALACDVIIACDDSDFALPEPKVGLFAGAGGVIRLPRFIPYHKAMSMILTGRRVKADEGFEMGFVSQVVKGGTEEVVAAALEFAEQVLLCSPDAIQASMQVVKKSMAEHYPGDIVGSLRAQRSYPAGVRMNRGPNRIEVRPAYSAETTHAVLLPFAQFAS